MKYCKSCNKFLDTAYKEECGNYSRLSVDHDHQTGKIRGLLCNNCNRAIGLLKDSSDILYKAAKYIEKGGNCG